MRDGGGEAGAQLLVGGEVTGRAEVDERLRMLVDLVVDLDGDRALTRVEEPLRQQLADDDAVQRLPRAPAGREHPPIVVQYDDVLTALLHQASRPADSRP